MSVSLKALIAEVFEELGCDINLGKEEKECKKGCTKQLNPGAVAGGYVFGDAKIALRCRGLAWGACELIHALVLALDDDAAVGQWLAGGDPLAAAALDAEQREAVGGWFDQVQPL